MSKPLHSAEYAHFLEELRAVRTQVGISQTELADRIHELQSFVSKVERGVRRLDIVELRRWTGALGMELTEFIRRFEQRLQRHASAGLSRTPKKPSRNST